MAKARGRGRRTTGEQVESPEDNETPETAVSPDPAPEPEPTPTPKSEASAVSLAQELPDRTPRVTIQAFVRGAKDPILRAFAHQEKLTHAARKLTRAEWKAAFEAFKNEPR